MTLSANVRDVVFPVLAGDWKNEEFMYSSLLGTAFLIGKQGFAVTAAHVVNQMFDSGHDHAAAFVDSESNWKPLEIVTYELHPTEDVAVIQLMQCPHPSWLEVADSSEGQSCDYDVWGYPIAVAEFESRFDQKALHTPELIYTRGYVRRRISRPLPIGVYKGESFYELSEIAGDGCSGGPMIKRATVGHRMWSVCGVYVGASSTQFHVGYAVRTDSLKDWVPGIIGKTLAAESQA